MAEGLGRVVVRAPGKINLSLVVGTVDQRGYHRLATVFQAMDVYETVTATRGAGSGAGPGSDGGSDARGSGARGMLTLEVDSEVPGDVPLDGTNLALRAAEMLRTEYGITEGAALRIHKQVPVAGGMGGGSADAAAVLVALDRLWGLDLPAEELRALGARLGADVPFSMLGHTALGRGTGADLTTVLTHGEWTWLLAFPGGHLSTPEVYRRHDEIARSVGRTLPDQPEIEEMQFQALSSGDASMLGSTLHNDLQSAAFALDRRLEPVVELAERSGAFGAMVSGSGPTVAALVEDDQHAHEIGAQMRQEQLVDSYLVARGSAPGASILEEA